MTAPAARGTASATGRDDLPPVAVIVPGWNSAAEVDDCLASLEGLDYPRERLELVWVDNGSTDGSPDRVEEHFRRMAPSGWRRLLLVRLPGNEGIPAAYNEGFARVSPDVFAVYRTETDVVHAPDCLARLVATLSGGESRGIVGVKVRRWPDGAEQCAAIRFDRWTGKVIPSFPKEPVRCEGVLGCAMLVRVAAIRRFPEFFHAPFRISGDEAELCLRFARAGYETWCDPAAEVFHKGGRSTGKVSDLARFYSIRNGVLIARRYAPGWVRPFRFAYHLAYAVKRLLGGDTLPARALLNAFGRGEAPPLPS